jgi:hypothetical protein
MMALVTDREQKEKWKDKEEEVEVVVGNEGDGEKAAEVGTDEEKEMANDETGGGEKQVATLEEDRLFGQKVGYPTDRRPIDYLRYLSTEPWETISDWFREFKVTIGPKAQAAINSKDKTTAEKVARLFYTWRDLFVEDMVEMPATDLVTHTIPTRENVIPRRARDKLLTPRE